MIVYICREKSVSICELLILLVLKNRNTNLRKGCASLGLKTKNL